VAADEAPLFAAKRKSGQRTGRGQYVDVTFAVANTDQAIPVALASRPSMYVPIRKSAACDVYDGANAGSDWTPNKIVLRSTVAATVTLYVN